jgi:hypothetical protein
MDICSWPWLTCKFELSTLIAAAGGVAAFLVGVYQYADKKRQSNIEPFLKEQLRLCMEASDAVARLAVEENDKWDEARRDFWRLYFGILCVVEDREVARAMIAIGERIPKPESPRPAVTPISDEALCKDSIELAHKVRRLILASWQVKLDTVPVDERVGDENPKTHPYKAR